MKIFSVFNLQENIIGKHFRVLITLARSQFVGEQILIASKSAKFYLLKIKNRLYSIVYESYIYHMHTDSQTYQDH